MRYKTAVSLVLMVTGVSLLLNQGITVAGEAGNDNKLEYRQAKALREQGKILPLQVILEKVSREHPGQIIETELEEESGRYIYELEIVDDEGKVMEIKVDATTGEPLGIEAED